ncbi:MAG: endolytic transglycosylase MltG [Bacteroidaceae bacterium]|nr:endolytic transglycosylase MltG [Bacteroidaceae bacterium]
MKKYASLITCLLTVAVMAGMLRCCTMVANPQISADDFRIYITPGETAAQIVDDIQSNEPEGTLTGLRWIMKLKKYDGHVRTGSYIIKKGAKPTSIYRMLASGSQTPVNVVINSCRTTDRMAGAIASQLMTDSLSVLQFLTDSASLSTLGYTAATVFELIIPNTYELYWNTSVESFMKRMSKEQASFWEKRADKAAAVGLTPHEIMTLASIVEEETAKADEMPVVAGLYMNRLHRGMLLQADPTVIFALGGERPKRVLYEHLNVDSPYNTYLYAGLPPAPIRFVSPTAIDAVLNYTRHNYLYMCAKEDFSGYHNFAATLSQHNANAARYQRALTQ